jgi:hypothetical protein
VESNFEIKNIPTIWLDEFEILSVFWMSRKYKTKQKHNIVHEITTTTMIIIKNQVSIWLDLLRHSPQCCCCCCTVWKWRFTPHWWMTHITYFILLLYAFNFSFLLYAANKFCSVPLIFKLQRTLHDPPRGFNFVSAWIVEEIYSSNR